MNYLRSDLHGSLGLSVSIYVFLLGIFIVIHRPSAQLNRRFFFVALTTSIWIGCYSMISLVARKEDGLAWVALSYLGVPFISLTIYRFVVEATGHTENVRMTLFGVGVATLIAVVMLVVPDVLCELRDESWGRHPIFRRDRLSLVFFAAVFTHFSLFALAGFRLLILKIKSCDRKDPRVILFTAFACSYIGSADWLTCLGLNIYPIGYIALAFLPSVATYLIIRHQEFNINLTFRRFSAVIMIYFVLFAILIPFSWAIVRALPKPLSLSSLSILSLVTGLFLSSGPAIYAYLTHNTFWLKQNSSAGILHEFKSPLSVIASSAEMIESALKTKDSETIDEYAQVIQRNARRLDTFVSNLLTLVKETEGPAQLWKRHVSIADLLLKIVDDYRPLLHAKGLETSLELIPVTVVGDREKLELVFSNILSNAIKFSDSGRIVVRSCKLNGNAVVDVTDFGSGIKKDVLPRIYERFFKASQTSSGAGIGLSLAKFWIEAHEGFLDITSDGLGKGTNARIVLPIVTN